MSPRRGGPLALLTAVLLAACSGAAVSTPSAIPTAAPPVAAPVSTPRPADHGPEQVVQRAPLARPAEPAIAVRYDAALLADHCVDRDVAAPPATEVALTVLDRSYALPAAYAPSDLVPASKAGLTGSSGTKLVRSIVIEDLAAMGAAWREAGLSVIVESAYRSYGAQAATFESWVSRLGYAAALVRSARPGHSEHQLGTAIDVTSPGWGGRFGDWAVESAEGAWMAENAWRHGFVMSYPAGSEAQTCFSYEPWHYRWIGREAAAAHRSSGMPLRQFLERHVGG
ncbi:MAG TPA: M15 family metallopeptidase [Patescibacteria group bacterium]|nr:M15 family metallopeptidase [Patescibacteria group bacterium]